MLLTETQNWSGDDIIERLECSDFVTRELQSGSLTISEATSLFHFFMRGSPEFGSLLSTDADLAHSPFF